MKPMLLTYVRLAGNLYKFFYDEGGKYGEFYIRLDPNKNNGTTGSGTLEGKDPEYAEDLLVGMIRALTSPEWENTPQGINKN